MNFNPYETIQERMLASIVEHMSKGDAIDFLQDKESLPRMLGFDRKTIEIVYKEIAGE